MPSKASVSVLPCLGFCAEAPNFKMALWILHVICGSFIAPRGSRPGDAVGHHRSLHHGIHFSKQQFTLTSVTMQIFCNTLHHMSICSELDMSHVSRLGTQNNVECARLEAASHPSTAWLRRDFARIAPYSRQAPKPAPQDEATKSFTEKTNPC